MGGPGLLNAPNPQLTVYGVGRVYKSDIFMPQPPARSSVQLLLPRYLVNGLNNFDKTDTEY